jgi:hypothetical protein
MLAGLQKRAKDIELERSNHPTFDATLVVEPAIVVNIGLFA